MDYDGTLSEVDGPTFSRGGFIRSSLPAARSPPTLDKPPGDFDLGFLQTVNSIVNFLG